MVQTRSATRRNSSQSNNQDINQSGNQIDSQLLNTMHLVRPSTGDSASTSGGSNISSPPGYDENIHQNQRYQNQNQPDDDLPTYDESQHLLQPNIEIINYENSSFDVRTAKIS